MNNEVEALPKNISVKKMFSFFQKAKSVAIFSHINPDTDAYGAMFALRDMCRSMGKKADCFAMKNPDSFLDQIFPLTELRTDFSSQEFDLAVIVDLNSLTRVYGKFVDEINKTKNVVNIDHHLHSTKITDNQIIDPTKAACCQFLLHFFEETNQSITPQMATYLWAGLIGDTDRFLHSNLTKDVLLDAAKLFELRAKVQFVYDKMYRRNSQKDIEIQNQYLSNTFFDKNRAVGCTIFTLKDMKKMGVDAEMVKRYTTLIINFDGTKASFLCVENQPNIFKIAIRTKGLSAQKFAKKFGGGGHDCASGFVFEGTKKQLKSACKVWMNEILNY